METFSVVLKEHSEDEGVNWMENGLCQSDFGGSTYGLSKERTCRMDGPRDGKGSSITQYSDIGHIT